MRGYLPFLIGLALAGTACNTTNRSYLRASLAKLPSGDEIAFESEVEVAPAYLPHTHCGKSKSGLVWRRISPTQYLVSIEDRGEVYVRDHGKVLTARGDTKSWHEKYGQQIGTATVRVSADGDRAWLVHEGKTIASFDYRESTAIFGEESQPAWAAPN